MRDPRFRSDSGIAGIDRGRDVEKWEFDVGKCLESGDHEGERVSGESESGVLSPRSVGFSSIKPVGQSVSRASLLNIYLGRLHPLRDAVPPSLILSPV